VIPPELTSRQRELLAAVSRREIAWGEADLELVDEPSGAHLSRTDVDALYDLEAAGLVDLGEPRPQLTRGGELLLVTDSASAYHARSERESLTLARGWLLAVAMSLASAALAVLAVWLIFGVLS
jgi:hypothetical protein